MNKKHNLLLLGSTAGSSGIFTKGSVTSTCDSTSSTAERRRGRKQQLELDTSHKEWGQVTSGGGGMLRSNLTHGQKSERRAAVNTTLNPTAVDESKNKLRLFNTRKTK